MYTHIHKKRHFKEAMQSMNFVGLQKKEHPDNIALTIVSENMPAIKKYVLEHGVKPSTVPATLAAQATEIHENKIWEKMGQGIPDYDQAEQAVLSEDQHGEDAMYFDGFLGGLLAAVLRAGNKAIDKINAKRVQNGKKPILAGQKGIALRKKIEAHAQLEQQLPQYSSGADPLASFKQTDAGIFATSLTDQIRQDETMSAVKKYAPWAIAAVILIVIIVRKTSK